jgi:hypothetical protein
VHAKHLSSLLFLPDVPACCRRLARRSTPLSSASTCVCLASLLRTGETLLLFPPRLAVLAARSILPRSLRHWPSHLSLFDCSAPPHHSKGEAGPGQHELNVKFAEILEMADRHTVYKQCLKEVCVRVHASGLICMRCLVLTIAQDCSSLLEFATLTRTFLLHSRRSLTSSVAP